MKSNFIVWFRLASGRLEMLGARSMRGLVELIRDLPRNAEQCSDIGRRILP
jgi:hypothetical protein